MIILLEDFSAKLGKKDILKPMFGNESLHQDSNDNGVRMGNFGIQKSLFVKNMMNLHWDIHKYIWTSPNCKIENQIDHTLMGEGIQVYLFCDI
jgi:hypothetical protein